MKAATAPAFEMPAVDEIANLSVIVQGDRILLPTDRVICINRGNRVLRDTYDGEHREIPPGYFITEYGAAMHFQRRQIVPGTRNLEVGGHVSYIGILGTEDGRKKVDPEDWCEKFSDEELQSYGERVEAIDRTGDTDIKVLRTSSARAGVGGQGASQRPVIDARQQANEAASEAAGSVFDPPTESATRQAEAEAAAEGAAPAPARVRRR